jgi:hypothetical protein
MLGNLSTFLGIRRSNEKPMGLLIGPIWVHGTHETKLNGEQEEERDHKNRNKDPLPPEQAFLPSQGDQQSACHQQGCHRPNDVEIVRNQSRGEQGCRESRDGGVYQDHCLWDAPGELLEREGTNPSLSSGGPCGFGTAILGFQRVLQN